MHILTTAHLIRWCKVTIVLMVGVFGVLVVFSNLTDYPSNYEFVGHILSMDTTQGNGSLMYRAITSEMMHHRFYWMIMTLESIFTACCLLGTYQLYRKINAPRKEFHEAKKYAIAGFMIAIFIYYFILQVIGNEWFDMDTSPQWNAMGWARGIVEFLMPALFFLVMKNDH